MCTQPTHVSIRLRDRLCVGLCALLLSTAAAATEVWVITDKQHPVTGDVDRQIELDAPARLEAELSAQLPLRPSEAAAIARQRLEQRGHDLQRRLASAYQGVADAWSPGVTKIPAVVVDRRYVVYGEPDVARALARVDAHRSVQR